MSVSTTLRLPDRRRDLENGLVREDRGSFRDREHVAGEAEVRQIVEQALGKHVQRLQIGNIVGAEAEFLQFIEKNVEAAGKEEVAAFRQIADEEAERRRLVHAANAIGAQHRQFIEIGEQTAAPASRLPGPPHWRFPFRHPFTPSFDPASLSSGPLTVLAPRSQ